MDFSWAAALVAVAAVAIVTVVTFLNQWRHRERILPWVIAVRRIIETRDVRPVDLPVEIMQHLLLGDKRSARQLLKPNCPSDHVMIEAFGVTHILNVAGRSGLIEPTECAASSGIKTLQLSADDEEGYPIIARHLHAAKEFINDAKATGGRCLIHCVAGINRSGCLATAALMLDERLEVLDAVRRVKGARRMVLENWSFQEQLVELARKEGLLGKRPDVGVSVGLHLPTRAPRKPAADALRRLG